MNMTPAFSKTITQSAGSTSRRAIANVEHGRWAHDEALSGYDRLGARTARVALGTSLGQFLDEAYQYDGLARLQRVDQGKVTGVARLGVARLTG